MGKISIIEAIEDKNLFRPYFKDLETWRNWLTFFKVLSGYSKSKLSKEEMELFHECTGLEELPKEKLKEIFLPVGRRGAKSTTAALLSVYYGLWGGWEKDLSPGEKAYIFIVSTNKSQSMIIKDYVLGIMSSNPALKKKVTKVLKDEIHLDNGVVIAVKPASWRTSRGFSVGLLIMEELAFWRFEQESQNRDREIYTAMVPSLSTISNSLVLGLSTPYARQGLLWEKFNDHWGKPGPILVWKAPSWVMNLNLSEEGLRKKYEGSMGKAEFEAEYGAQFREDIEGYLPLDVYERVVVEGRTANQYKEGIEYRAFCDPSEGLRKGGDSMTLGISHFEQGKAVLDLLMEFIPPFSPSDVLERIVKVLKSYKVSEITQDRHAVGWISDDLGKKGVRVKISERTKSQIYAEFAILVNKGTVELLDNQKLRNQTLGLQRFLKSGGVKIDHIRGGHDDVINSAAGACLLATEGSQLEEASAWLEGDPAEQEENEFEDIGAGEAFFPGSEEKNDLHIRDISEIPEKEIDERVKEAAEKLLRKHGEISVPNLSHKLHLAEDLIRKKLEKMGFTPIDTKRRRHWVNNWKKAWVDGKRNFYGRKENGGKNTEKTTNDSLEID